MVDMVPVILTGIVGDDKNVVPHLTGDEVVPTQLATKDEI